MRGIFSKFWIVALSVLALLILSPAPNAKAQGNAATSDATSLQGGLFPDAGKYSVGLEWGNEYLGSVYLDSRYWMNNSRWGIDAGIGFGMDYGGGFGFHAEPMYTIYTKNPKFIVYADADLAVNFGSYDYGYGSASTTFWSLGVGAGIESDLGTLFNNAVMNNWGVFLQWNPLSYYNFSVTTPTALGAYNASASGLYLGAITAGFHYYF